MNDQGGEWRSAGPVGQDNRGQYAFFCDLPKDSSCCVRDGDDISCSRECDAGADCSFCPRPKHLSRKQPCHIDCGLEFLLRYCTSIRNVDKEVKGRTKSEAHDARGYCRSLWVPDLSEHESVVRPARVTVEGCSTSVRVRYATRYLLSRRSLSSLLNKAEVHRAPSRRVSAHKCSRRRFFPGSLTRVCPVSTAIPVATTMARIATLIAVTVFLKRRV